MSNLKKICADIVKQFGEGSSIMMDNSSEISTTLTSTGFLSLDIITGGGIPLGRQIEVFGSESAGKTTLALQFAAQMVNSDCYYIDMEQSLNVPYLKDLGINESRFAISQPDTGTEALSIAEMAIKEGVGLIVIDSVAALLTQQEMEGDYGDANFGSLAKFMSNACRKINPTVNKSDAILCWINQTRDKIGGYSGGSITTGGRSLRFYTTQRFELTHIGQLKDGEQVIGSRVRIKMVKNKVAPPFRSCELDLIFGKGFCKFGDILDIALENKVITKAGSWYSFGDKKLGQGREAVREQLSSDNELCVDVVKSVETKV